MFAEKLDFLMKLTNTRNSVMGRAISLDDAHISRLRSGARALPKKQSFVAPMAIFLAKCVREDYQKRAVAEAVCHGREWPEEYRQAAVLLEKWMTEQSDESNDSFGHLISGIAQFQYPQSKMSAGTEVAKYESKLYGYGHEGKRAAVLSFLTAVCRAKHPRTLLLYSDEPIKWLYEDEVFAKQWSALLVRSISRGNRIRIIHTVSRSLDEMLEALTKWIPLYMTGAIEPRYYTRIRDGVFCRTLFIAPGLAAVSSSCVTGRDDKTLNLYVEEPDAVSALETEFSDYDSLCQPLMHIFRPKDGDLLLHHFSALGAEKCGLITAQRALSLATMPESVVKSICARAGDTMQRVYKQSVRAFRASVGDAFVQELIALPDAKDVIEGRIPVAPDYITGTPCYYTKEEYRAHLKRILLLCERYDNYRVSISDTLNDNMMLYCKTNGGALICRLNEPQIVFIFDERNMTAALDEYLTRQCKAGSDKTLAVERIKALADKLK